MPQENFIDGQMKKKGGTDTTSKVHEDAMTCVYKWGNVHYIYSSSYATDEILSKHTKKHKLSA